MTRGLLIGLAVIGSAGCVPLGAAVPEPPPLVEVGHEPELDPNLVYDDDPGMACYPTDRRSGERVDVCHWLEP